MLIYRSTPIRPGQLSPAELFNQRTYRALLPIHQYLHPNLEKSREADSTETDPSGLLQSESQAASESKAIPECSSATGS